MWTVWWMRETLKFHFSNHFFCHCYHFRSLLWCNTTPFVSIPLHVLQIVGCTILCTVGHLSMTLLVLEDGSIKVPKQCQHCFASKQHTWISWSLAVMYVSSPCFDVCLQVHSGAPMFHCLWKSIARNSLLICIIAANIAFMFSWIPVCDHLWAALAPTLHKFCDTPGPCG
jgi:hypothetical protein